MRDELISQYLQDAMQFHAEHGSPYRFIYALSELTTEEKAFLYDMVILMKKGRSAKENPFKPPPPVSIPVPPEPEPHTVVVVKKPKARHGDN